VSLCQGRRFTIAKTFIDTNVLIYAEDGLSTKRERARALLREILSTGQGVISTQVMQETYHNLIRKLGASPEEAAALVHQWSRFEVVVVTPAIIGDAMKLHAARQHSFWDALIVASAAFSNCSQLYSEDMSHGQLALGVTVVNPFQ